MKKFYLLLTVLLGLSNSLFANDSTKVASPFSASLELTTKYMWRGIEYGTAPTVFPMIGYGYKGFNAFAMGAYAVNGSHQEVDLGVSYSNSGFTVGVSDYYYPSAVGEKDGYFKLSNRSTGHWVEAYATWSGDKFPLWITLPRMCLVRTRMRKASKCTPLMPRWATLTPSMTTIPWHSAWEPT